MSHVPLSTWRCCMSSKNPQISRLHTLKMVAHTIYIVYSASSYNHITNEKCVWLCWFKTYFSVINVSLSSVPPRATFPNHHHHREANCDCTRRAAYPKLLIWKFSPSHASFVWLFGLEKEYHSTKNDLFFVREIRFFLTTTTPVVHYFLDSSHIMTWQQERFRTKWLVFFDSCATKRRTFLIHYL